MYTALVLQPILRGNIHNTYCIMYKISTLPYKYIKFKIFIKRCLQNIVYKAFFMTTFISS